MSIGHPHRPIHVAVPNLANNLSRCPGTLHQPRTLNPPRPVEPPILTLPHPLLHTTLQRIKRHRTHLSQPTQPLPILLCTFLQNRAIRAFASRQAKASALALSPYNKDG